ncbi:MAG: PTS transporter subunit EIIB, partial [Microcoleaceae cyanobacterium]
ISPVETAPVLAEVTVKPTENITEKMSEMMRALGGANNIKNAQVLAMTRLRLEIADEKAINTDALTEAGVQAVMNLPANILHLIVGLNAPQYLEEMKKQLVSK